ncbi:MAG: hypothetical protein R6V19_11555 [Armatimonadota bacterium]
MRWFLLILVLFALLQIGTAYPMNGSPVDVDDELREEFDRRYRAYREKAVVALPTSSRLSSRVGPSATYHLLEYEQLLRLGLPALPLFMEAHLGHAVKQITGFTFDYIRVGDRPGDRIWYVDKFPDMRSDTGQPKKVLERWYATGETWTPKKCAEYFHQYNKLKANGEQEQAGQALRKITELGIAALPWLVQRIGDGNTELIPIAAQITKGKYRPKPALKAEASPRQVVEWWEEHKQRWVIPWPEDETERSEN